MRKINRKNLLSALEMVLPGLSPREIIEQSSCFVFKDGHVFTYNDEIACSHPTDLKITGAVVSDKFMGLLRKLEHEELEYTMDEDKGLAFKRRGGRSHIRTERKILLPYQNVAHPKKWKDLPSDFLESIDIVKNCASADQSQFALTCLLFTPEYIDACDRFQACRYHIKLPIKRSFLIRRDSVSFLSTMDVSSISESKEWVHFKNDSGLVISCRRYSDVDEFHPLDTIVKKEGNKLVLPKNIKHAVETSAVFVSDDPREDNRIHVSLKKNKIYIKGAGIDGDNTEVRKTKYDGKEFSFVISATLLTDFAEKFSTCYVNAKKLCVSNNKFSYATSIGKNKE